MILLEHYRRYFGCFCFYPIHLFDIYLDLHLQENVNVGHSSHETVNECSTFTAEEKKVIRLISHIFSRWGYLQISLRKKTFRVNFLKTQPKLTQRNLAYPNLT